MITMYTARTAEVDVFDEAIAEIKSQIDFSALKKHSGGIVFCCKDYSDSGMLEALCNAFPFDVVGMTTMGTADNGGYGFFDLTFTVLTSDEVQFTAGMAQDIDNNNYREKIDALYGGIREKVNEDPSFIVTFMPYSNDIAGYKMLEAMDKSVNGIPIWGSLASSIDFNNNSTGTMYNGKFNANAIVMLAMNGPVTPRYIVTSLPTQKISNSRGIVTKSDGAVLNEINDIPVKEYFSFLNVEITFENIRATPLMVYHEGTEEPVALAIYSIMEDGGFLVGGAVPVGSAVSVGGIDTTTIIESCRQGLDEVLACPDRNVTLSIPCVSRGIMMAPDQQGELRLIYEKLNAGGLPFAMGYAGGEISPMTDVNGNVHNRFHNYTFCACVLS
jgi:hypothetical protein